jgi:hypothetical protein
MAQPIDYASPLLASAAGFNPAAAFQQGQQVGQGLMDARAQGIQQSQQQTQFDQAQQDRAAAIEAAKQKAIADAQARQQLMEERKFLSENPTVANVQAYMARHPEESEASKRLLDSLAPAEKEQKFDLMARTLSAIDEDRPDIAEQEIRVHADALREKRPQEAKALDRMADRARDNPKILRGELMKGLLNIDAKFFDGYKGEKTLAADVRAAEAKASSDEQEANLKTEGILAEIGFKKGQTDRFLAQTKNEAARLGLDWAEYKLKKAAAMRAAEAGTVDLDTDVKKAIEADAGAATAADSFVRSATGLAGELRKEKPMGGIGGLTRDAVTGFVGADTDAAALNQRYIELRNGLIKSARKPGEGPMSDSDFKNAAAALPGENAPAEAKARTLDRLAKQAQVSGKLFAAAARYRALTGGPGGGRITVVVDDVPIPPKTDLASFNSIMTDHYLEQQERAGAATVKKTDDEAASFGGTPVGP